MQGAKVWRDYDLGVSKEIEQEFQNWLVEKLPYLKIEDVCEEDIKVSDNLTIYFRAMPCDDEISVISRPYTVYEVIINGCIGSSFFIREFEDNYSKTFVYEMHMKN